MKVEKVDGVESQVYENEENVGEPEEDFEQSQSSVEPESVIRQATIGVFHQHESKILIEIFRIFRIDILILPKQNWHKRSVEAGCMEECLQASLSCTDTGGKKEIHQFLVVERIQVGEESEEGGGSGEWNNQSWNRSRWGIDKVREPNLKFYAAMQL